MKKLKIYESIFEYKNFYVSFYEGKKQALQILKGDKKIVEELEKLDPTKNNKYLELFAKFIKQNIKISDIQKLIPDIKFRDQSSTSDTVSFVIKGRNYPLESLSTLQTIDVTPNSTFSNTRARSRQCALRVTNSSSNYGWRLGDLRLDIRPDGKR